MQEFDLKPLEDELYRAGLEGFRSIRKQCPNDTFYCFAFYTSGGYDYVVLTASTLEGLAEVVGRYAKMPMFEKHSTQDLSESVKWSPCDSPLHMSAHGDLPSVRPLVQEFLDVRRRLDDCENSVRELNSRFRTCIANALKRIEAHGVFGTGEERKKVVVNLLMGDQGDEDRIAFASRVNPPEAVAMLKEEFEASNRAWDRRHPPKRKG